MHFQPRLMTLIALSAMCLPRVSHADWQYTRWGMSPEDVMAASAGIARANDDRGKDATGVFRALLKADYDALGHEFTAYFGFDANNQLVHIGLEPNDPSQCGAIRADMLSTYGPPEHTAAWDLMKWWHEPTGNLVLWAVYGTCSLSYSPLFQAGQPSGL